jgi:hypothetical protein
MGVIGSVFFILCLNIMYLWTPSDHPDLYIGGQIIFQLADRGRKCRLGNMAGLRRPREMLFAREGDEIA